MNEQTSQANTVESGQDQQILGFVASTEGATVVVVSPDGTLRELKMGDPIHEGDILQVTDGSHVAISFADGSVRQLNSGDSFVVGLDSYQQLAAIESAEEENPEFQELLATLAAGEDVAEDQEATAAGAEDGASGTGDEIGQGLQFSLLGGEVTPTAGIDPDYVPPPLPDPTANADISENGNNNGETTNNVAVVTNDARSVTEDQDLNPVDSVPDTVLSVTGAISVSDDDQGESAFDPGTLSFGGRTNSNALDTDTAELGTLTLLDDQGNYSFAVDNAAVQYLAAGDTVVQTWTVESVDGSGTSTITITINGVDDGGTNNNVAVVTNDARSVTEDQDLNPVDSVPDTVLSVTGAISVSDDDQGESAFDPGTLSFGGRTNSNALDTDTAELGTLTLLDDQGNYSFAVDNAAVQYLAAGDTVVQTWTVESVDGSGTSTITITINGVDDGGTNNNVAVVTNDARSVTEDQDLNPVDSVPDTVLSVTGAISVSDDDQGESAFDPGTLSFGGRTNSNALDTDTAELGTLTLLDDQGNYSFAVDNAAVQYLAAGDTVVQTWTVESVDGSGTSTITITINGTNDGPVANPDTNFVNKSIVESDAPIIYGNVIAGGDNGIDSADSFAGAEQYADVADTDVDLGDALRIVSINNQSVSVGTTAANGTQLAGLYGVLTIGADGSYAYDLDDSNPLLADLDTGEELNEVFNYTVSDSSGAESSSTLTITVNGESQDQPPPPPPPPLELGITKNLYVGLDELVIKNLQVGFVDATFVNGTANTSEYNTDSDPYIDQLGWGRPVSSTGQSGYTLVDNNLFSSETGSTVDVGSTFKIADFQHLNFPIAINSSILQEVYLVLNMDIVINGVHLEKPIDLKLLMSHDETPNDSGDPRDIISLPPQMITVNMDGFDYDFHVLGFRDVDGNLVDAIYTNENAVNDFEIVGSFTSSSENPQVLDSVSGTVGVGNDDVVTWADTSSEYGTLTVSEDGSYEYILNGDIKNVLDVGENLVDSFEYTVTNQNGSTTSTLEINISGYQNIYGSSGDDSLTGTSANEYLTGAAGDDVLNGAGGDDVLIGGPGNDILTGGLGADVFKWVAGDEGIGATDTVTDFNQSSGSYDPSEGDILDLSDLLVGLDSSGMTLAEALDASFLTITSDGTDTSIVADVDGAAAGTTTQTIVLQGVDLTNGGEFSSAEVIESLISNNNLVVD